MKTPQKTLSFLYCCASGNLLNEENPPHVSPDFIVFGENYIESNIEKNLGSFVCPFTENVFTKQDFRKLFI